MTLTREELQRLALPLVIAIALIATGVGIVLSAGEGQRAAQARLAVAQSERRQNGERLARIAEEEREVSQKLDVYKQLKSLNILGEERRLEWADAISRIRVQRELLDVRYRVERQKLLTSVAGRRTSISSPAPCASRCSSCTRKTCFASSPTCAPRATPSTR
jgi:hypothetical protein